MRSLDSSATRWSRVRFVSDWRNTQSEAVRCRARERRVSAGAHLQSFAIAFALVFESPDVDGRGVARQFRKYLLFQPPPLDVVWSHSQRRVSICGKKLLPQRHSPLGPGGAPSTVRARSCITSSRSSSMLMPPSSSSNPPKSPSRDAGPSCCVMKAFVWLRSRCSSWQRSMGIFPGLSSGGISIDLMPPRSRTGYLQQSRRVSDRSPVA